MEVLPFTKMRWLSRSRFLIRFLELIDDVKRFLCERGDTCPQVNIRTLLRNLAVFTDFSARLSELNLKLWGKGRELLKMTSSVGVVQQLTNIQN